MPWRSSPGSPGSRGAKSVGTDDGPEPTADIVYNRPHAEASGANAGSLHVQFQTFGFPDLAVESAIRAPVSTLAMQKDSVYLWDEFAAETDADIEVEIEGGLTVADDVSTLDIGTPIKIDFVEAANDIQSSFPRQ